MKGLWTAITLFPFVQSHWFLIFWKLRESPFRLCINAMYLTSVPLSLPPPRTQTSFHGVNLTSLSSTALEEYFRQPVLVSLLTCHTIAMYQQHKHFNLAHILYEFCVFAGYVWCAHGDGQACGSHYWLPDNQRNWSAQVSNSLVIVAINQYLLYCILLWHVCVQVYRTCSVILPLPQNLHPSDLYPLVHWHNARASILVWCGVLWISVSHLSLTKPQPLNVL